jgi:hypothetical protein
MSIRTPLGLLDGNTMRVMPPSSSSSGSGQRTRLSSEASIDQRRGPVSFTSDNPIFPWTPPRATAENLHGMANTSKAAHGGMLGSPFAAYSASGGKQYHLPSEPIKAPLLQTTTPQAKANNPPPEAQYREAAFQTLIKYGILPTSNSEGFEKMMNQLAQAFAKQHINPGL